MCREAFICYKQEQSAVDRVCTWSPGWSPVPVLMSGRATLLAIDSTPVGKCAESPRRKL